MSARLLTKFSVFAITVLLADLVKEFIIKLIPAYQSYNPYKVTAINMALAVCVFVPAFAIIEKFVKTTAVHYVKKSKIIPARRIVSILLGLVLALIILFSGFLYVRYHIQLHKQLFSLIKGK